MNRNYNKNMNTSLDNNDIKGKYLGYINDKVFSYLDGFTKILECIENDLAKEFLSKYKVESSELNIHKVEKLLVDFFHARNINTAIDIKNGLKAVFKKIKIDIASSTQVEYKPLKYDKIEEMIKNEFRNYVNKCGFNSEFNYVLLTGERNLVGKKTEEVEEDFLYEKYVNKNCYGELIDSIIDKLDYIEDIIESYGLTSIHAIEFTPNKYISLKDCITKKKYSKVTSVNLELVCKTLMENDTRDFFDFTSENYILFLITLFDCMYLAIDFYNSAFCKDGSELVIRKNILPLINNIKINYNYFIDKEIMYDTNFYELYVNIHNEIYQYDYNYYYNLIMRVENDN